MKIWTIALLSVRRLGGERTALFYVLLLPLMILLVVGSATGGAGEARLEVGMVSGGGPLATELRDRVDAYPRVDVVSYDDPDELRDAVRRRTVLAGIVLGSVYDQTLMAGGTAEVSLIVDPALDATAAMRSMVSAAVTEQAARLQAARFASVRAAGTFDEALERAGTIAREPGGTTVESATVGAPADEPFVGGFNYQAPAQVILFVFITSAAASGMVIESRRLGVTRRMLATPTRVRTVVAGEGMGRFGIALTQALIVFVVSTLLFGVRWGHPVGAALVILLFCLVATGVGLLMGTTLRTAEQAGAIGPPLGIALGMLGGCMWPLEIVPTPMRVFGHLFPHAWAMDAWIGLIGRGEGVGGIAVELGVLAAFAAVLLPLSVWRLRRSVVG